jgi:hypothetical protein
MVECEHPKAQTSSDCTAIGATALDTIAVAIPSGIGIEEESARDAVQKNANAINARHGNFAFSRYIFTPL